jgi:hypothetical protein
VCIFGAKDRALIEEGLFEPFFMILFRLVLLNFLIQVHNHSTWECCGWDDLALVMDDAELLDRALRD